MSSKKAICEAGCYLTEIRRGLVWPGHRRTAGHVQFSSEISGETPQGLTC